MRRVRTPVKAIRKCCLNCSETEKMVAWCPCDGLHSNWCPLWAYRFGIRPETASQKYGKHVVTPEMMPGADVSIDDLPANPADWSPITRQPVVQDDSTARRQLSEGGDGPEVLHGNGPILRLEPHGNSK